MMISLELSQGIKLGTGKACLPSGKGIPAGTEPIRSGPRKKRFSVYIYLSSRGVFFHLSDCSSSIFNYAE
jgi:hypothetical protein